MNARSLRKVNSNRERGVSLLEVSGLVTRYPVPRSLLETLRRREQLDQARRDGGGHGDGHSGGHD